MAHAISLSGVSGQIKWGYRVVAAVDAWSIEADATGGTLTATLAVGAPLDAFGVTQQPLRFVVPRKTTEWEWLVESLQITDDRAVARLSPSKE